jgi:hypothetical protein
MRGLLINFKLRFVEEVISRNYYYYYYYFVRLAILRKSFNTRLSSSAGIVLNMFVGQ